MATPASAPDPTARHGELTDGRRARAERSRDAVVDAILELLYEGNRQPGAADIAERAGVSLRSVFRHFDDLETLHAVAVERHSELISPLFELDVAPAADGSPAPLAVRIDLLVKQRSKLFEEMVLVRVVAERLRDRSASIRAGLERSNRILRGQLLDLFEPELDALDKNDRRTVADALVMVASYAAWRELREDQSLSIARSAAVMTHTITSILTGDDR